MARLTNREVKDFLKRCFPMLKLDGENIIMKNVEMQDFMPDEFYQELCKHPVVGQIVDICTEVPDTIRFIHTLYFCPVGCKQKIELCYNDDFALKKLYSLINKHLVSGITKVSKSIDKECGELIELSKLVNTYLS